MYRTVGQPNEQGFYSAFSTGPLYTKEELLAAWSTPEQREFNATHVTCTACRGQGVRVTRRGKSVIRDNVGCEVCGGIGAVKR